MHEHLIPHVGSWMHLLSRRSHVRVLARPDHTVVRHREVVRWHRVQRARRREQWNEGSVPTPGSCEIWLTETCKTFGKRSPISCMIRSPSRSISSVEDE